MVVFLVHVPHQNKVHIPILENLLPTSTCHTGVLRSSCMSIKYLLVVEKNVFLAIRKSTMSTTKFGHGNFINLTRNIHRQQVSGSVHFEKLPLTGQAKFRSKQSRKHGTPPEKKIHKKKDKENRNRTEQRQRTQRKARMVHPLLMFRLLNIASPDIVSMLSIIFCLKQIKKLQHGTNITMSNGSYSSDVSSNPCARRNRKYGSNRRSNRKHSNSNGTNNTNSHRNSGTK